MIKSSLQKPTTIGNDNHPIDSVLLNNNNNNSEIFTNQYGNKSLDILPDDIDPLLDTENVCDMLGIKSTGDMNNSIDSILSDLEGLENEQSLLDDLLYGGDVTRSGDASNSNQKIKTTKRHPRGKPPTGRSPSPSIARVGGLINRSRSSRSRSLAHSSDSDTASRVSFDMPSSDLDDSGNGKDKILFQLYFIHFFFLSLESHDDDNLGAERIQLLSHVRTARVCIEQLRLNMLNTGRESPSHSSFGRTNKSKRAT
jgi:hypothetical protein